MNQHPLVTRTAAVTAALSLAVLAACGGGGTDTTAATQKTAATARLATYVTDNLATEYSQVWVGVLKITAVDSSGTEVTLYSTDTANVVNVSSLASVGQLMSTVSIPAGVYRQIRVTLADTVKLVSLDGTTTLNAAFTGDGSNKVIRVDVTVDTATDNALVLDFDLARFTYNATTQLVTPTVVRKDGSATKQFKYHQGEVHGTVVSTDATANTVTVNDPQLGATTVIKLTSDAVITREGSSTALTLADLTVGTRVQARGVVTSAATDTVVTVQVSALRVEATDSTSAAAAANKLRGVGKITAVSGSVVTVLLTEANFLPASASLKLDVSAATYAHGLATDLSVGAVVGFRGALDASSTSTQTVIKAAQVDIAGAASARERDGKDGHAGAAGALAELTGTLSAMSGTTWTVTVTAGEHGVTTGTYTVDTSAALSKAGSGCVAVGSTIEARGSLTGTTLAAKVVELKSACAAGTS